MVNTLWWNNTIHFGLRGRQEHYTMLWGNVELGITATGLEYIACNERDRNKTKNVVRDFVPKMFEQPGDTNFPVKLLKGYMELRPEKARQSDCRFYLQPNRYIANRVKSGGMVSEYRNGQRPTLLNRKEDV